MRPDIRPQEDSPLALNESGKDMAGVSALYIHIPFCVSKCAYCDFPSWACDPSESVLARYTHAIEALLNQLFSVGLLDGCRSAYVGGGTPTLLGQDLLGGLISHVMDLCGDNIAELSFEANPESSSVELYAIARQAGATRVSIGVQSTSNEELRQLHRIHDAKKALSAIGYGEEQGLDVSADLMCAIPEQTEQSWKQSLADVVSAGVNHVSVYPLSIEEGTTYGRLYGTCDPAFNDEDIQATRMEEAEAYLSSLGFVRYEVASYARPGKNCLHNEAYWTGRSYIGVGTGAASMLDRDQYGLLRSISPQLPALRDDAVRIRLTCTTDRHHVAAGVDASELSYELEELDRKQATAEDLMLRMRLAHGISPSHLALARDVFGPSVDKTMKQLAVDGLVSHACDGSLACTHQGWLLGNEVFGPLWDLHGDSPTHSFEVRGLSETHGCGSGRD